jgi:hypothetical protein
MKDAGGGPVGLKVELNGRQLIDHRFSGPAKPPVTVQVMRSLLQPGQDQQAIISAEGKGRPFWSVRLSYAPDQPPDQPVNAGFGIARLLRPLSGAPAKRRLWVRNWRAC